MSQSKPRKYLEALCSICRNMLASFMWVKFGFQEDTLKIELVCLDFAIAILRNRHTRMFEEPRWGRISSWELLQSFDWREYGPLEAHPVNTAAFVWTKFGEAQS